MVDIFDITAAMSCYIGTSAYYDRDEDKIILITGDDSTDEDERLCELIDSDEEGRFIYIPQESESYDGWNDMVSFIDTVADDSQREYLSDAVHGRGAFSRFRGAAERLGLLDDWYAFKDDLEEKRARRWCESNGVPLQG